jgi:hypothetical protein
MRRIGTDMFMRPNHPHEAELIRQRGAAFASPSPTPQSDLSKEGAASVRGCACCREKSAWVPSMPTRARPRATGWRLKLPASSAFMGGRTSPSSRAAAPPLDAQLIPLVPACELDIAPAQNVPPPAAIGPAAAYRPASLMHVATSSQPPRARPMHTIPSVLAIPAVRPRCKKGCLCVPVREAQLPPVRTLG